MTGHSGGLSGGHSDEDDTDAAFQAIVENFGERATLGDGPGADLPDPPSEPDASQDDLEAYGGPGADGPAVSPGLFRLAGEPEEVPEAPEHFEPPPPPPVEWPEPRRGLAWVALFGSPTALLVTLVVGIALPAWLTTVLGASFVGGFVYLVATMRQDRGDGWDDGARL